MPPGMVARPVLDHPHPVDAPDRLAVDDEIGHAEYALLDRGIDRLLQRALGVVRLDVPQKRLRVDAERARLLGNGFGRR